MEKCSESFTLCDSRFSLVWIVSHKNMCDLRDEAEKLINTFINILFKVFLKTFYIKASNEKPLQYVWYSAVLMFTFCGSRFDKLNFCVFSFFFPALFSPLYSSVAVEKSGEMSNWKGFRGSNWQTKSWFWCKV